MAAITRFLPLAGVLFACTSVKMVQRDGCWVKQTSRTLGGTPHFCETTTVSPSSGEVPSGGADRSMGPTRNETV